MRMLTVLSLTGMLMGGCASSKTPAPVKASTDAARSAQTPDAAVDVHSPPGDYPEPTKEPDQPDF